MVVYIQRNSRKCTITLFYWATRHDIHSCTTRGWRLQLLLLGLLLLLPPTPPALHIVCVAEGLDWTMVYDYIQGMYLDQYRTRETTKIHSKFITSTTSRAARNEHLADRDTGTRRRRRNKTIPFRWFSAGYFIFLVHCQGTIKQTSQGLSNIIVGKDVLVLCILLSHLNVVLLLSM